jgi:predicted DNA-binding antitoxin AbrB/MazE fold protein
MKRQTCDAIYENGVLRPLTEVTLKEGEHVRIFIEDQENKKDVLSLALQVYKGLSEEEMEQVEKIALARREFFGERS